MKEPDTEFPEPDRADGCLHPRHVYTRLGHDVIEQRLARNASSGKLHHAWLFTGPKGVGKATMAYRFARAVLGGQAQTGGSLDVPQADPVASRVASLGHGDFLLIRRPYDHKTKKLKSEIIVSEIQRIHDFFSYKSSEGGYRVCLIDSADEMNRNAANAVLKILEEPPAKAVLILLSSEPGRLLPTIRSRCLNMRFRPIEQGQIQSWLTGQSVAPATAALAAALSRGAPGRAFALAAHDKEVIRPLQNWIENLPNPSEKQMQLLYGELLGTQNETAKELFWDALTDLLAQQARYSSTGEWDGPLSPLALSHKAQCWTDLWADIQHLRAREAALNLEPQSVMLTAFDAIMNGKRVAI